MAFLTKDELKSKAPIEIVDAITKTDDTVVNEIITESISEMKSHMSAYDVATIFSDAGRDLDGIAVIVKCLKALVICELFRRRGSDQGDKAAEDAIIFLEKVMYNKVTLSLPLAPDPEDADTAYADPILGSEEKYTSDF